MPQPYFEMEESRSVTPWVNRLYFESPRASSFLGLRLVKTRHKNLVLLLYGVKPDPMVGSGRYAEPIPVKSPLNSFVHRRMTFRSAAAMVLTFFRNIPALGTAACLDCLSLGTEINFIDIEQFFALSRETYEQKWPLQEQITNTVLHIWFWLGSKALLLCI